MTLLNDNDNSQPSGNSIQHGFQLDSKLIHLNNSTFGTAPKSVEEVELAEKSLGEIANMVDTNPQSILFINNPTQSANTILRSLNLAEKDTLFYLNIGHSSVNHGTKVVVDGVYALGQIILNSSKNKVNLFTTILYEWGYAYRSTSVLYVRKEYQSIIHPTVIAVGYGSNNFQTTFQWPGTIDFSCWLATDVSLDFIEKYGQDNIINYIHNLAWEGGQRVAKLIGGKVLGEEHQSGNMVNYFYLK